MDEKIINGKQYSGCVRYAQLPAFKGLAYFTFTMSSMSMPRTLASLLLLYPLLFGSLNAQAESSGVLALGSSGSSSAISKSSEESSNSSKSSTQKVAQGPYEVTAVAVATDNPDALRLTLHALQADAEDFELTLPRQIAEQNQIAVRSVIEATAREYGLAFALRDTAGGTRTFFLVLEDEWHKELDNRLVTL
jgi:hypothetical protein